jgi:hypothetical protein
MPTDPPRIQHPALTHRRLRVAAYLAAQGPTPGDRLAELFGLSLDRFWQLIHCPWFRIEGRGWVVTARGREALQESGTKSDPSPTVA